MKSSITKKDHIIILGQEVFLHLFYNDWEDPKNSFSDPLIRTLSCSATIQFLAQKNKLQAEMLFNECNLKKAWNPNIGAKNDPNLSEKCEKARKEAFSALNKK